MMKQLFLFFLIGAFLIPVQSQAIDLKAIKAYSNQLNCNLDSLELMLQDFEANLSDTAKMAKREVAFQRASIQQRKNQYDTALVMFEKLHEMATQSSVVDSFFISRIIFQEGIAHHRKGNFEVALSKYLTTLRLAKKYQKLFQYKVANNLGLLYYHLAKYEQAYNYYVYASQHADLLTPGELGVSLNGIGMSFYAQQQFDSAKVYYQLALVQFKKINSLGSQTFIFNNLGIIAYYESNIPEAIHLFHKALEIRKQLGKKAEMVESYYNLASLYAELNQLDKAIEYSNLSLALAQKLGDKSNQKDNYFMLSEYHSQQGNTSLANEYLKKYITIDDSIYTENMQKQLAEADKKLELEKLRRTNEQQSFSIERTNFQLKIAIAIGITLFMSTLTVWLFFTQKRLKTRHQLSMLQIQSLKSQLKPHFLFNLLNSMQNLIIREETDKAVAYISDFATLMRKDLETFSKKEISLKEELNLLTAYLKLERVRFKEQLNYQFLIDEQLDLEKWFILPMLLQPLVENAIIHGISPLKQGEITISVNAIQGRQALEIIIKDNGVGFKNELSAGSRGLDLTQKRLKLWKSTSSLSIQSPPQGGVEAKLVIQ
ncbi:MAG: tetratricopeptide repeat protein [Flammeovirgaceae bacterium]